MYQPKYNCFRQDLVITSIKKPRDSQKVFLIKDPRSGETFEFGEEEYFLCNLMDGKLTPSEIIGALKAQFELELTVEDFDDFASFLLDSGLLVVYDESEKQKVLSENESLLSPLISAKISTEFEHEKDKKTRLSRSDSQNIYQTRSNIQPQKSGLVICNPSQLFQYCASCLSPFYFLTWLIIPGFTLAILTIIYNRFLFWDSLLIVWERMNPLLSIFSSLITINFISEIAKGIVFSYYGGKTRSLEIRLKMGFLPRFAVNLERIKQLTRKSQSLVFATPLLTRISVFSISILTWKMVQNNQTQLENIVLYLAQSSVIGLLVDSSPFWDSNGYRWFSTYFRFPRLFEKTLRVWGMMLNRRPFPENLSSKEKRLLQIYACLLVLVWVGLFVWLGGLTAILLEQSFQGVGVVIFLILLALILRWYVTMNSKPNNSESKISEQNNNLNGITSVNQNKINSDRKKILKRIKKNRFKILTFAVIAVILGLPYKYRPGGSIELLPPQQQDIQADISGKIIKVFFKGGDDTWVKKGKVIATMQASKQLNPATPIESDVLVIKEQIQNQKAIIEAKKSELDRLLSIPRKEDIKIAQTDLQTAQQQLLASQRKLKIAERELELAQNSLQVTQAQVEVTIKNFETAKITSDFRGEEASRFEELYNSGGVSLQDYEDKKKLAEIGISEMEKERQSIQVRNQEVATAQQNLQVERQKVEEQRQNVEISKSKVREKQANLELVLSGPNPNEIETARNEVEAAKANLKVIEQQLSSAKSQLEGTNLFMPFDGYLTTPFLDQKVNTYLEQGSTFAVAEDNRNIQGRINVPETDVGLFEVGQEVEVKLSAYPNLSLIAKIVSIEPVTQTTNQGRFVQVIVKLPNSKELLKSGMSGYAKTEGKTMPVIMAFTRPIVRFIQIEVWSWLP